MLAERQIHTDVLAVGDTSTGGHPLFIDGHHVHVAKRDLKVASTDLSWEAVGRFRDLAAAADVVHYHHPWPAGDVLYWLAGRQRPSVVTYHSDIVKQRLIRKVYAPLMHKFLDEVDCIVATSTNYRATSKVLQRHDRSVSVIPIGIGPRRPVPDATRCALQARVGEGFFLFLGTMRYYKGIPYLVEAARLTGLPVVLAGAVDQRSVADLPPNVTSLGEVDEDEKEALLDLCRAFVFPSNLRSEAFGIALLEGARAGKPLISCEIGTGTSSVNVDGETGLVVAPSDSEALAAAMRHIVANPDAAAAMGRNARARYERHFTAEEMADSYLRIYGQLSAGGRPATSH